MAEHTEEIQMNLDQEDTAEHAIQVAVQAGEEDTAESANQAVSVIKDTQQRANQAASEDANRVARTDGQEVNRPSNVDAEIAEAGAELIVETQLMLETPCQATLAHTEVSSCTASPDCCTLIMCLLISPLVPLLIHS